MKEIIEQLKTHLGQIGGIQEVYMYRDANPTKYPAIICNWDSVENNYLTTKENKKTATFNLYAIVNIAGKSMQNIDETIIPKTYDKISQYFDENWNFGISIAGHRVWSTLSMASSRISVEQKSKIAYLDCVLKIEFLTDN